MVRDICVLLGQIDPTNPIKLTATEINWISVSDRQITGHYLLLLFFYYLMDVFRSLPFKPTYRLNNTDDERADEKHYCPIVENVSWGFQPST